MDVEKSAGLRGSRVRGDRAERLPPTRTAMLLGGTPPLVLAMNLSTSNLPT